MRYVLAFAAMVLSLVNCQAQLAEWKHSGSVFVLTTPEGANLPASVMVENFPLLVRLHKDFFDFSQAKANGEDLRFSTKQGESLAYQIEEWDANAGFASIWVRVPKIVGNARQELKLHWGNLAAKPVSDGRAVFNESNGYLSVWHMNEQVKDEVGTLQTQDTGTTLATGMIGKSRFFPGQKGLFAGEKIESYPAGSASHSSEAWIRASKPNGNVLAWGNEQAQGKVVMHYRSPPHIRMDCYFSGGDVVGQRSIPLGEWAQVVHTYEKGSSKIYVNGVLDTVSSTSSAPLNIRKPSKLWIGGWYHNYNFVGHIDEVRISKVVRSADWIRLQYENQKAAQTLVGPVVQAGQTFSVSQKQLTINEGQSAQLTANAGGAQKVYWIVNRGGTERIAAVDQFNFTVDAGRVVGDTSWSVRFKAIYPDGVKTQDIEVNVRDVIPEPKFRLKAPETWDGRSVIEVVPEVTNLAELRKYSPEPFSLKMSWNVSGIATINEALPTKLILNRAQNSGTLQVKVAIDNGGTPTEQSSTILVKEPAKDPWLERIPDADEKPVEGQFYARNDKNEGTLYYNGKLEEAADSVVLKLYANGKFEQTITGKPSATNSYSLTCKLKPGLIKYKVEFGTIRGGTEKLLNTVSDLVCGDAYLIDGQSNAEATDVGREDPPFTSEWIRSYGSMGGSPNNARLNPWGKAVIRSRNAGQYQIGCWGMELAKRLMEGQQMPICIINGAVGGSRIDVHQRNQKNPADTEGIYGRLFWRIKEAKLTHGIRAAFWHQGENDQGADGPTGGYGYETYQQYFVAMTAGWKTDYPNIQQYYVFQIWPKACSMGSNGSDNRLREVQRNLTKLYSNLHVMSTLGIQPPGGCHFPIDGYAEFAKLIAPLVERDHYGKVPTNSITAPNLKSVFFTSEKRDQIALEFDQPVNWEAKLVNQFFLDGKKNQIRSGMVKGSTLLLKLGEVSTAKNISYLDSASWSQDKLLRGENGIAALTFCEVAIREMR